jgi:hypothetical protein
VLRGLLGGSGQGLNAGGAKGVVMLEGLTAAEQHVDALKCQPAAGGFCSGGAAAGGPTPWDTHREVTREGDWAAAAGRAGSAKYVWGGECQGCWGRKW